MTRAELEKALESAERREFFHAMKDRWSREDFAFADKISKEIKELKEQLAKLEA